MMSNNEFINLYLTGQIEIFVKEVSVKENKLYQYKSPLNFKNCTLKVIVHGGKYAGNRQLIKLRNGEGKILTQSYELILNNFPIAFLKKLKKDFNLMKKEKENKKFEELLIIREKYLQNKKFNYIFVSNNY